MATTSTPYFEPMLLPGQVHPDELAALLEPDSPIVDRLLLAACVAAQTCRSLSANDLRNCASKLFDVPPVCELAGAFVSAYQNERDAMAGKRQTEKRLATRA